MTTNFNWEYSFLSNSYMCKIVYNGIEFTNSESAWWSMICKDISNREKFKGTSPNEAKVLARELGIHSDWHKKKDEYLYEILICKFTQHEDLFEKLEKIESITDLNVVSESLAVLLLKVRGEIWKRKGL